ncbi:MAG TPA: DMT family transporter, partial [Flavitalea sp.]|nr:DMT family transporter [Flavitalea sp.]
RAFILLHLAIMLAGFTGVFGRLISINAGLITWYRLFFSAVFLSVILLSLRRFPKQTSANILKISFVGLLLGLHWVFFYASIKFSNISIGVVCFSLGSFFTALIEPVMNKRKHSVPELVLSGITLAGIGLIFGLDATYRFGIMLGVISSLIVTFYTIYNKRLTKEFNSQTITLFTMIGGCACLTALMPFYLYLIPTSTLVPSSSDLIYLILLALVCTVLMYLMITEALQKISAFTVNLSFNLEPIYSIVLAIIIYKENTELSAAFYTGLGMIVLSVVLQMIRVMSIKKENPVVLSPVNRQQ